jgi:hypothetical protein
MLIVHDTLKGATAAVAGIDDPGFQAASVLSRKKEKDSRHSFAISTKSGLHGEVQSRDSATW